MTYRINIRNRAVLTNEIFRFSFDHTFTRELHIRVYIIILYNNDGFQKIFVRQRYQTHCIRA